PQRPGLVNLAYTSIHTNNGWRRRQSTQTQHKTGDLTTRRISGKRGKRGRSSGKILLRCGDEQEKDESVGERTQRHDEGRHTRKLLIGAFFHLNYSFLNDTYWTRIHRGYPNF